MKAFAIGTALAATCVAAVPINIVSEDDVGLAINH